MRFLRDNFIEMQYNWHDFTKKSLVNILKQWEHLILPANERGRVWRQSWSKADLADYMEENNVFVTARCSMSNAYNLEMGMRKWNELSNKAQKYEALGKLPILSRCEPHVVSQIFKDGLTCTICLEEVTLANFVVARCGHHYCDECFEQINECSLCKKMLYKGIETI